MKNILLLCMLIAVAGNATAQPFRYIVANSTVQRDSIRLLKIKGYHEYTAPFNKPEEKKLTGIVEYDRNGNLTRHWRVDINTGKQNQYTNKYDEDNKLLEHAMYFPDSLTLTQRTVHKYDKNGNETEIINEFYTGGKLGSTNKTIKEYDHKGNCIDLKTINDKGIVYNHYKYVYDAQGRKIEEITFYNNDKTSYRRKIEPYEYEEEQFPIGFPTERDKELEELLRETVTIDPEGNRKVENGYAVRIFNRNNMLIEWLEKNYRKHWFGYSYYE